jgi:hypothetical protein
MKIAILDDYQNVAMSFADWDSLDAEIVVFTKPFADADEVVRRLAGFDATRATPDRPRQARPPRNASHPAPFSLLVTSALGIFRCPSVLTRRRSGSARCDLGAATRVTQVTCAVDLNHVTRVVFASHEDRHLRAEVAGVCPGYWRTRCQRFAGDSRTGRHRER